MLSGNGRHRRPRQAPALLVAAGVTGSAIAIPLLGATGASAASGTTWDQVAECESGGFWSADTGNGRYGGLQLTQANWEKYGGLEYAKTADLASRSQQIAVAEKVLADQGVGVWSTCGLLHNLGGDSGSADVDTGVVDDASNSGDGSGTSGSSDSSASPDSAGSADSAKSTDDADSGDGSGKRAASPDASADTADGSAKATTDTDSADSTGSGDGDGDSRESDGGTSDDARRSDGSAASEDGESGTGRHRGASAEEGSGTDTGSATESGDGSRADGASSGRHASRDGGASREAVEGAYTVRVGDSLTGIVNSLGLDGGWRSLYSENERTVGTDPDLILPGQTLEVGAETGKK
ncbi:MULTISPECIES: transglycosylase family protein [Streptomyces]|uniref:LysM peptidoglycan-binding domain-containing protein n=4 Tax=Streptomyces scabiei TaxID=1930 RepID=UPI0004E73B76|nr:MULTISPECIES: transglycosylase family protein [Streptomyces]MBP5863247.1 peptigoglycan-binding protein LysM [Streptomyces sp. LBUM 1484]MBP5906320.1 peptigoglycan-binding protein LysM [Streptomyces sp. LBUM 1478]MBP5931029.1 peptigoglycan-binding protein LysM [Streptomyces sp. LBUM 1479]KFG08503.1 peptigoglycan-binding protein LysM [Streptomyces scabiei]MBP5876259.1 peptigoglycan-binding protein LysM [Streptomyces sp. LBUM 1477]